MQGIEFEENNNLHDELNTQTLSTPFAKQGFIIKLLEKTGVTDKSTVNLILLSIAAIFFGITIYLYAGILGGNTLTKLSPEQMAEQQRAMKEMMGIK